MILTDGLGQDDVVVYLTDGLGVSVVPTPGKIEVISIISEEDTDSGK